MPNIDSAKKRVKQDEVRKERNKAYKSRFKNSIKKVLSAIEKKAGKEELMTLLSEAFKSIDKAASKGAIHKNQAARRKSRLHIKVKKFLGEVAPQ
ncbi:MAG TPA: 30S ribosomal protein S20 [Petrotogaceae bacterium]|nr:30S ribosomal protein S20 [Petrotogaceae bacterium]HOG34374.1 30S ribosomal protein S20 [Petrotogaceae bacterium]HPX14968.1 30S ribosomal protein S20 [Petrotogaceae bacterium]HQC39607.1 30S ribosomal protein S20 [Petrotogaceae bacterium]